MAMSGAATTAESLLSAASALAPLIREHADAAERDRRAQEPVIDAMARAGVFHMFVPRALGGLEADPATGIRVLEALGSADGSAGWCAMIGSTTGVVSAYLRHDAARHIFGGGPGAVTGGVVAPRGTAETVDGGYRVSGRWPFASGCQHSDWLLGGSFVRTNGEVQKLPSGDPDVHFVFFPASEVEIIDTWHVSGLRGTGSHDMAVNDLFVPSDHTYSVATGRALHDGSLYRLSMMGLLSVCVAAVGLGIARTAIDTVREMAQTKVPMGRRNPIADWATGQQEVARAEASLRSARAFVFDAIGDIWETLGNGDTPTNAQRAIMRLSATNAAWGSVDAVDRAYNLGGGSSIYETSPLQRCFRDIHTLTQHVMVAASSYEAAGRALLGKKSRPDFCKEHCDGADGRDHDHPGDQAIHG
jgi:alkylation response protein AidB-like acyl-CoA dehydrogenase